MCGIDLIHPRSEANDMGHIYHSMRVISRNLHENVRTRERFVGIP